MIIFMIEVTSENGIRLTATENTRKEIRLLIIANNILFSENIKVLITEWITFA